MATEIIWKQIPNFSNYEASNFGTIRNKKSRRILSTKPEKSGYICNSLNNDDGVRVKKGAHGFICLAFHGEASDEEMTVDHIDRNPINNKSENLRWATHSVQMNNKEKPKERAGYPLWQLDPKTKEKLRLFDNTTRAAEFINGHRSNIGISARKGWLSNGFYWEYEKPDKIDDENWVKITRNNKQFYISNKGRVKNTDSHNRLEILNTDLVGYVFYICNKKDYLVHRLVAETFLDNPDNLPVVNHKDCNKANNDVNNLEWTTHSGNIKHAWDNGCFDNSKQVKKVYEIDVNTGEILKIYKSASEANKILKLGLNRLSERVLNKVIKDGKAWSYESTFTPKEIKPRKIRVNPGRKKVYKYTEEGTLVQEYTSISEASREENIPQTSLKVYYIGKFKDGFQWSYDKYE